MKQIQIIVFLVLFLGISCQDVKHVERPDNLIPEDKMAEVLTEVALLNAARNYNKFLLEQSGLKPNEYIYNKFDIDSVQFEKSNAYYTENYNEYESIYEKVKDSLETLKTIYEERKKQEKKNDSLQKIKTGDEVSAKKNSKKGDTLVEQSKKQSDSIVTTKN